MGLRAEEELLESPYDDLLDEMVAMEDQFFSLLQKMKIRLLTTNTKSSSRQSHENQGEPKINMEPMGKTWNSLCQLEP